MDCEGAEFVLLDPRYDPILSSTDMIIEVHPDAGPMEVLIDRFAVTHATAIAFKVERQLSDAPTTIPGVDIARAMDERRGLQTWLYFTCKK